MYTWNHMVHDFVIGFFCAQLNAFEVHPSRFNSSLLCFAEWYSTTCMYRSWLVISIKVAMNNCVEVGVHTHVFFFGLNAIARSCGKHKFNFLKKLSNCFSGWLWHFTPPICYFFLWKKNSTSDLCKLIINKDSQNGKRDLFIGSWLFCLTTLCFFFKVRHHNWWRNLGSSYMAY